MAEALIYYNQRLEFTRAKVRINHQHEDGSCHFAEMSSAPKKSHTIGPEEESLYSFGPVDRKGHHQVDEMFQQQIR